MEKNTAAKTAKIGKNARIGEIFQKQSDKRGVDRDSIELGVCISVVFQSGQCPRDLKQDFLIQVVPVGGVPGINTPDLENLQPILIHQRNKLAFRILAVRVQCVLFSLLVEKGDQNITNPGQTPARPLVW